MKIHSHNKLNRAAFNSKAQYNKIDSKYHKEFEPYLFDEDSCITSSIHLYKKSKFQLSDFKDKVVQDKKWISKPRFILESKQGQYYKNTPDGVLKATDHLLSFYFDLDQCLTRLYNGYHDSVFCKIAFQFGMFKDQQRWNMIHIVWDNSLSYASEAYYKHVPKYDPNYGINYVAFFETHFSKFLSYEIARQLSMYNEQAADYQIFHRLLQHSEYKDEDLIYDMSDIDLGII